MGYRRPHHRRAHTRVNSDGSKSYVKETDVKGHNYERKQQYSFSNNSSSGTSFDDILAAVAFGSFLLTILGGLLRWDDAVWYLLIFLVSLIWFIVRNK